MQESLFKGKLKYSICVPKTLHAKKCVFYICSACGHEQVNKGVCEICHSEVLAK
jgi:hypothetical protein